MNNSKRPQYKKKTTISALDTLLAIKAGESVIIDGSIIKVLTVFTTVTRLNKKRDKDGNQSFSFKASVAGLDNKVLVTRSK